MKLHLYSSQHVIWTCIPPHANRIDCSKATGLDIPKHFISIFSSVFLLADRRKYSRDFLLQFQYCDVACERPAGLALLEGVTDAKPGTQKEFRALFSGPSNYGLPHCTKYFCRQGDRLYIVLGTREPCQALAAALVGRRVSVSQLW